MLKPHYSLNTTFYVQVCGHGKTTEFQRQRIQRQSRSSTLHWTKFWFRFTELREAAPEAKMDNTHSCVYDNARSILSVSSVEIHRYTTFPHCLLLLNSPP